MTIFIEFESLYILYIGVLEWHKLENSNGFLKLKQKKKNNKLLFYFDFTKTILTIL